MRTAKVDASRNPIWQEYFTFTESSVPKARGLTRKDLINVLIMVQRSSGKTEVLGRCDLDLAFLVDKVGYIDLEGKRLLKTFDLYAPRGPHRMLMVGKQKPQVRLSLELKPIAETRMASYHKLVLKIDKLQSLKFCAGSFMDNVRKVYIKGTVGTFMFETVSSMLSAGFVYMNHLICTSSFEAKVLHRTKVTLRVYADLYETLIGTVSIDLARLEEDKPIAEWYKLEMDENDVLHPASPSSLSPRQRSADSLECNAVPELFASVRVKRVEHELKPVLGYIDVKLLKMKMFTDGFDHSFRGLLRYGPIVVSSRTYARQNNVVFEDTEEANFQFPVHDMYTCLDVWVEDVKGRQGTLAKGKAHGRASLTLFDLIEWEAKLAFFHNSIARPAVQRPIKLDLRDAKGRTKGTLLLLARFDERLSGTLATNANPMEHPKDAVNLKAVFHEMNRTSKILGWMSNLSAFCGRVMSWESVPLSLFFVAFLVTLCSVDFWTSRSLALIPFGLIAHVLHKYAERRAGAVITGAAEKIGEKDVKARLLVTAVRGEGLVPMDVSGKSDPFVQIGYRNCADDTSSHAHRIGKTRTVAKTLNPHWAHNIFGFKPRKGASLFAWGSRYKDGVLPSFESYIPKCVFKTTHLQLRVLCVKDTGGDAAPQGESADFQIHAEILRPAPNSFVLLDKAKCTLPPPGTGVEKDMCVDPLVQGDSVKADLAERFHQPKASSNQGSRSPKRKKGKRGSMVGEEFTFLEFHTEGVAVVRVREKREEAAETDAFCFIPIPQILAHLARHGLTSVKLWLPLESRKDGEFHTTAAVLIQVSALGVRFDAENYLDQDGTAESSSNGLINAEVITTAKVTRVDKLE